MYLTVRNANFVHQNWMWRRGDRAGLKITTITQLRQQFNNTCCHIIIEIYQNLTERLTRSSIGRHTISSDCLCDKVISIR